MIRYPRRRRKLRVASLALLATLLLVSVGLIGIGVRQLVHLGRPATYRLEMLTDPEPNRQVLARRIAAEARKHGLVIELSPRAYPSLEALALVNAANPIDLALVPGGVGGPGLAPNVRQVAALGIDPLHVMVRPELYESAARSLAALRGKRINCGPPASAMRVLAREVLRFSGLRPATASDAGDYRDEAVSSQDLLARLDAIAASPPDERAKALAALPDAAVFMAPLPSLLARRMVAVAGYRMVGLPFVEAYTLDRLNLHDPQGAADGQAVDRCSVVATTVPPQLYGNEPPVPPEPCRTVGTRLLLVAYAPSDPEAIARLLEVVYESPLTGLLQPPPLRDQVPQFELHRGSELYLRRRQPLLTPELMSQLARLLGGLGAFVSGILALYGFLRIIQLRRFESYYHEVRRIVQVARGLEDDPDAPLDPDARRVYLMDQLDDLKSEAIRDFADGGLKGEGLLAGVVALVNDTRNSLTAANRPPRLHPFDRDFERGADRSAAGPPDTPASPTPRPSRTGIDSTDRGTDQVESPELFVPETARLRSPGT
jgi:hypothetical protein